MSLSTEFRRGKRFAQGIQAVTKLIELDGVKLVAKLFKSARHKTDEEDKHLNTWKVLPKKCKTYLCEPIKTSHPLLSLQRFAAGPGETAMPLSDFNTEVTLEGIKLSKSLKKLYGSVSPLEAVRHLFVEALMCLHLHGIAHGDMKPDNIVVVFRSTDSKVITRVNIKIIDFGSAKIMNTPLVFLTSRGSLNVTRLQNAMKSYRGRVDLYGNDRYLMHHSAVPKTDANKYIKNQRSLFIDGKLSFDKRYKHAMKNKQDALGKRLFKQKKRLHSTVQFHQ